MDSISEMTVFAEVVQAGSFVGAARRLGLTASGVSRKIGRFEQRLGVRLFNRTTRSLSLTEPGEALFQRSSHILDSIEAAEGLVRDLGAAPKGTLRVAASDAFALLVLVPFLRGFLERYDGLSVTLVQGDGPIDLLGQRVDVAIRFEQPSHSSFITRKLIDDPWILCASPDYLRAYGRPETPAELQEHRCLTIHARGRTTNRWRFRGDTGRDETLVVESAFSGIGLAVKAAALQGLGIARLAHFLVWPEVEAGLLVPLLTGFWPKEERAIHAVYPNRQYLPSKTRVFIDELGAYTARELKLPAF